MAPVDWESESRAAAGERTRSRVVFVSPRPVKRLTMVMGDVDLLVWTGGVVSRVKIGAGESSAVLRDVVFSAAEVQPMPTSTCM